jgi:hypothetical protein
LLALGSLALGALSRLGAGSVRVSFVAGFGALSLCAVDLGAFSAFGLLAGRELSPRVAVSLGCFGSFGVLL